LFAVCGVALAMTPGCAADPGSGVPEVEQDGRSQRTPDAATAPDVVTDAGFIEDGTTPDAGTGPNIPYLEFVAEPVQRLSFSSSTELEVRLIGPSGAPLSDASVRYELDELRAGGSGLRSLSARTNDEGIAAVTLVAGALVADFDVEVSAPDVEGVLPIVFQVAVAPKEAADYVIQLHYGPEGPLLLQSADVYLYNDAADADTNPCRDIPRDPDAIFGALDQLSLIPASDGSFEGEPYEAQLADIPITHAVAVAYVEDTPVAFACTDAIPRDISAGENTVIDLFLTELFPDIEGEFRITMQLDLLEFLPEEVEQVVDVIGTFFRSPGQAVFDILDLTGVLSAGDFPTFLTDLLIETIDGILFAVLPDEAVAVFRTGEDIFATLRDLKLQGAMIFTENPNSVGALAACNELVLDEVIVAFDTIETPPLNLRSYGYSAAEGVFTGWLSVFDDGNVGYNLNIQQFQLELQTGELIVFILEAIVFPRVIDPSVDSMEAFVRTFLDCRQIADDVGWSGLEGICDIAIDAVVGGLRDLLVAQTSDLSFYFLETADDNSEPPANVQILDGLTWGPCAMDVQTDGGAFSVDALGGPGDDRCVWDASYRLSPADPVGTPVPSAFNASRISTRANSALCGP
jgi:hypothetical protein